MKSICKYSEFYNNPKLPSLFNNISDTPIANKDLVLKYLKSFKPTLVSPQIPTDLFTQKHINIELYCSNDGEYLWRSDFIYYFEKYNLKLDDCFIRYVLNKKL